MGDCEHRTFVLRRSAASVSARCSRCGKSTFTGANHVLAWERGIHEEQRKLLFHGAECITNKIISLRRFGDEVVGICNCCGAIIIREFSIRVDRNSVLYPQVEQRVVTWKLA